MKIYVVPAKGLTVIDPATNQALPPEGAEVEESTYWMRRKNEGDVSLGSAPATKKAKD